MFQGMRYVYSVYREQSFSKAAAKLYISQPSLSAAVKKVEEQIGFPIFDRSTVPIRLTELGQQYIRSIEIIMDVEKGFQNYVNDINELKEGSFSIGGTNLFVCYVLPAFLSKFLEKYPRIQVHLAEASSGELAEQLNDGKIDLIIDNTELDDRVFEKKHIYDEHLLLTVPKKLTAGKDLEKYAMTAEDIRKGLHIHSHIQPVPLDIFKDAPFLLQKAGNDSRIRAEHLCREWKFSPNIRLELDQQVTAYNLSCAGLGISFSGDILIRHVPANTELLYFKLSHQEAFRTVNFYCKRSRYLPKAAREFLRTVSPPEL